jgi:hypothetical protein
MKEMSSIVIDILDVVIEQLGNVDCNNYAHIRIGDSQVSVNEEEFAELCDFVDNHKKSRKDTLQSNKSNIKLY